MLDEDRDPDGPPIDEDGDRDYEGPPIDDPETLARLPAELAELLAMANGIVRFGGGLHVRGACHQPDWHSLRGAWDGDDAFHRLYPGIILPDDIPFAEDCLGDQFILRDGRVWKLAGETGELEDLGHDLAAFLDHVEGNPVATLDMEPLVLFEEDGGLMEPGQLLSAVPPFCFEESEDGIELQPMPTLERRRSLAELAAQVGGRVDPPSTPTDPSE